MIDFLPNKSYLYKNLEGRFELYASYMDIECGTPDFCQEPDESTESFLTRLTKELEREQELAKRIKMPVPDRPIPIVYKPKNYIP